MLEMLGGGCGRSCGVPKSSCCDLCGGGFGPRRDLTSGGNTHKKVHGRPELWQCRTCVAKAYRKQRAEVKLQVEIAKAIEEANADFDVESDSMNEASMSDSDDDESSEEDRKPTMESPCSLLNTGKEDSADRQRDFC